MILQLTSVIEGVRLWQKTWKNSIEREAPAVMRTTVAIERKEEESSPIQ